MQKVAENTAMRTFPPLRSALLLAWLVLASAGTAHAQVDYFWRGDSADPGDGYNWNTANNWWRGFVQAPQGSENIIFDNNHKSGAVLTNNLGNAARYQILFQSGSSDARTVTGGTENIFYDYGGNVPRIANNGSGLKTLAFPIKAGFNNFELNPNGGGLTVDRLDHQGNNINVRGNGGHTLTIRGELRGTGAGGLTIQSNSTVSITGIPTSPGVLTVNAGQLRYGVTTGTGHTNTIQVGATGGTAPATLFVSGSGVTVSNRITVRSGSSGVKTLGNLSAGAAAFSGAMTLETGVTFSNAAGGSLTFSGPVGFNSGQRTLTVPAAHTATVSGAISGDGGNGMIKQGGGVLRLAGANTYTGDTTVDAGTLAVVTGGNLGSGSDVFIASGAVLTTEVSVTVASLREKGTADSGTAWIGSGAALTVNGTDKGTFFMNTIAGPGGLTVQSAGTTLMRLFGANTYTGDTVIDSGTLGLWDGGSIAASPRIVLGTNATLDASTRSSGLTLASGQEIVVRASGSGSPATLLTASGTGTVSTAGDNLLVFAVYSGGGGAPLTVSGTGSLSLDVDSDVIVTNTGSALGVGTYKLIAKSGAASVAGTAPTNVTVAGGGVSAGAEVSLSIVSGELFLDVASTEPDVLVLGNGNLIADGSTTPSAGNDTDFGDALVVGGTVTRTFTITNSGVATLLLGNLTTNAGGNPGDFEVTAQPGSFSLAAGATTTFQVRFDPSADGTRFADLEFTNNVSGTKNPYTFRIQGFGTFVEIAVSGNGVDIADGDAAPSLADHTDFGSVGTVGGSLTRTYTITNTGNRAMTLGTATTSGAHAAEFVVVTQPASTLNAGESTTLDVQFSPAGIGTRSAELSFSTTDDSYDDGLTENPFTFAIQGLGVAPAIAAAPASLSFSSVLGSAPAPQNLYVTNVGLGNLAYAIASNTAWLGVSPVTGWVGAAAGQAHSVTPTAQAGQIAGVSNATLTVSSATATNSPVTVTVSWTLTAIPDPTAVSATMDGNELVRLAWTPNASYNVMILHRAGGTPTVPTNGTAYTAGYTFADGTRVLAYDTAATAFEHIVAPGSAHEYVLYSINNGYYSPGAGASVTAGDYRAGEIVDPGAYSNGTAIAGANTGSGWTGGWITGGSGTWTAQTNYSAGGGADVPGLQTPVNFPAETANRFTVTLGNDETATARKTFAAVNSGKLYIAGLIAYRFPGNNKFMGISFMNGAVETGFVGKAGGGSVLAIDTYGGSKVNGSTTLGATETSTGNVHLIVASYDFATRQIRANAYAWDGTVPASEPVSWEVTATVPGSGISSIDGVRIGGGGFSGEAIGAMWFDEIRVASSWADLLGFGAAYATNYQVGVTNQVTDGDVAAGAFPVAFTLRSDDGLNASDTNAPYFLPRFNLLNPTGNQVVADTVFSNRTFADGGLTLIASNDVHAPVAVADVVLGVYTARWSAVSSNGVQAVNIAVLSNGTPTAFTVVDDDTAAPVLQGFDVFGSSGNATLTVSELISGSGWAITGLVSDADSGINVNGNNTTQPDISPYFELWDPAGVLRLRQAFNQISFGSGGAASPTAIVGTNNNGTVSAPLGTWTARVVGADADIDRIGDRRFATNEFSFTVTAGDSTSGINDLPTLVTVTSFFGAVSGAAPWPTLGVTNVGVGPLIYDVAVAYNNGSDWLSVAPTSVTLSVGGDAQIHTSTVSTASLNPGTYEAVIAFNGNQTNGARYVTNRLTVIGYNVGEIVEPFTNAAGSVNGSTGGSGWNGAWNAAAAYTFQAGNLATPGNYPAAAGGKACGDSDAGQINAVRTFPAITAGKVYVGVAVQKSDGNSDGFYGVSFMNGATEEGFVGKLFNDGNFGLDLGSNGGSQSGGFGANGAGSVYMFLGMYDFSNNTFHARAYNGGDTLPITEPGWAATRSPTVPIASIDGVRLAAKDEGTVCFDELRVASSWEALLNQFTETPTLHATDMAFTNVSTNVLTVTWTPGNGLSRIVVAREGGPVTFVPASGTVYAANNNLALATDLGGGNKVVYDASGDTVTLAGLDPETAYHFAVFEYNGSGLTASYYTNAGFLTGSRWTLSPEPAANATDFDAWTVSDTSISNTWTQAAGSPSASGYLILRAYQSVTDAPIDGVAYTNGELVGASTVAVVTPGTAETYLHTGLASCSNVHFRIHAFRWNGSDGETINYNIDTAPAASAETTCEAPDIQAGDIVFTLVGTNRLGLAWQNGNGQGRVLVVRGTNAVNQNPVDGTAYTANPAFGSGANLGDGNFVVYAGTGSAVEVTGLFPGATYHFRLYEYNGAGSGIDYNITTTNGNPLSAATASFGMVEDKFDYGAGNLFGLNGGTGWTNAWNTLGGLMETVDGNFGAFSGYPADTGTRQALLNGASARSASRNFPPRTSGRLYLALKINPGTTASAGYFGVNLLNGAASGTPGSQSVTGFFGKAFGVADNKLSLEHNGTTRTNKLDGSNEGYALTGGPGNDFVVVAVYDFEARSFKAVAYTLDDIAHADPDRENAWMVEMDNVTIERIDGVEVIGSGLGSSYFDHIRIGPSWEEVLWNLPDDWHAANGPEPTLVYIGTNYSPAVYDQIVTNLSDAELASSANIDFAVRWDSPAGIFLTNQTAGITNIGSPNGRVNPNWDPLAVGAATNALNLDRFFTNFFGQNGASSVTTYQFNAFSITNLDFSLQYFVTVSAETEPGGTTITAPNGGDAIPVNRAITINQPLRFYVFDDDTNAPTRGVGGIEVVSGGQPASFQEVGDVRRYFVTDGDLADQGMDLSLFAYDSYSGLQRATGGDPATNLNLTIPHLVESNLSHYAAAKSTADPDTTLATASSVWSFADTLFDLAAVSDLWGGDGSGAQGQDLTITATVPDRDRDRVDDQMILTNELFGYLRLLDDDIAGPEIATARVAGVSADTWINTPSVTLQWSQAVDDLSGIGSHRYVVPAELAVFPTQAVDGIGVGGTVTGATVNLTGQGVLTGYVFAVDGDNDRTHDASAGNVVPVVVRLDTNPPPAVAAARASDAALGNLFDTTIDESAEIKVEWSPFDTEAEAAGWRNGDEEPLSPWDSYILTYYEVQDTNAVPLPNAITTVLDRTVGGWETVLDTHTFTNLVLSNLNFDAYYAISIQGRDEAGNLGAPVNLIGNTDRFIVTQGVARAGLGVDVRWTGPTNELIFRDYDVLYVDSPLGFRNTLSNQWQFMTYTNRPSVVDFGAVDRSRPGELTGETYRFYRVARQDRWQVDKTPRVGSEEVYVAKALPLHPGENWYSMFSFPDPATTNETEATVATVFGTNLLPRGATELFGTRISWFSATSGEGSLGSVPTATVWLANSGWTYSLGGAGSANDKRVPLNQAFLIELPITADPTNLVLIGRVPTQEVVHVISGAGASLLNPTYHILSMAIPERLSLVNLGISTNIGFRGGFNIGQADEIRILDNSPNDSGFSAGSLRSPKARIYFRLSDQTWRTASGAPANGYVIEPDDALIIVRRHSNTIVWTNRPVLYDPPTKNFTP